MKKKLSVVALLLGASGIVFGLINQQNTAVLYKAIVICLECIGIG